MQNGIFDANLSIVETDKRRILVSLWYYSISIVKDRTSKDTWGASVTLNGMWSRLSALWPLSGLTLKMKCLLSFTWPKACLKTLEIWIPFCLVAERMPSKATVDYWMKQLRERLRMNIVGRRIFVPRILQLSHCTRYQIRNFVKALVDDEQIWIMPVKIEQDNSALFVLSKLWTKNGWALRIKYKHVAYGEARFSF